VLSEFKEASKAHLARLDRLVEKGSVAKLRRIYQAAASDLERKLSAAIGSGASPFTIHQHQVLLAQVRQGIARMVGSLGSELGIHTQQTQEASARGVIQDIKRLEQASGAPASQLPIEQASRFAGVVDRRRTSLLALNKSSMARYGSGVIQKIESVLSQSLLTGETGHKVIDRVSSVVGGEWWRAERIARTEGAWAYNATQIDAISATAPAFPDIMTRWTELVTDVTLSKMDDRVGDDSCAMHGQLIRPGGLFGMPTINPANLKISESLLGKTWTNPPNRPNDRAVLQPWRPGWGWGWVLVNGGRGPAPDKAEPVRGQGSSIAEVRTAQPVAKTISKPLKAQPKAVDEKPPAIVANPTDAIKEPLKPQPWAVDTSETKSLTSWPKITRPIAAIEEAAVTEHTIGMGRIGINEPEVIELQETPDRPFAIGVHHVRGDDETDAIVPKPELERKPTGTTSIWQPGDEARPRREVVFPATEKIDWYERDKLKRQQEQDRLDRQRKAWEADKKKREWRKEIANTIEEVKSDPEAARQKRWEKVWTGHEPNELPKAADAVSLPQAKIVKRDQAAGIKALVDEHAKPPKMTWLRSWLRSKAE
jgi:hypothetical protein